MTKLAIKVENLSKEYVLGSEVIQQRTFREMLMGALNEPINRLKRLQGSSKQQEHFWALKDINFSVNEGDVVGIIGANGAGKSTLLKVLSRITAPTEGQIQYRGKIASLLEVGTGFHPELTGRENIYVNGAILGMRRDEIRERFDEIVEFAGVAKFLDTPVKRYSSGMYVRLAFSVAAHLDPDILIIDEVLAVGDTAFQKKCLGKMQDVAGGGRSVLFVSHNLSAIRSLCPLVLLMEKGRVKFYGPAEEALAIYENSLINTENPLSSASFKGELSDQINFSELTFLQEGKKKMLLDPLKSFEIDIHGQALKDFQALELKISIFRDGQHLACCFDTTQADLMRAGEFVSRFKIPANILKPGRYTIGIGAVSSIGHWMWGSDIAVLNFQENPGELSVERNKGAVVIPYTAERVQ